MLMDPSTVRVMKDTLEMVSSVLVRCSYSDSVYPLSSSSLYILTIDTDECASTLEEGPCDVLDNADCVNEPGGFRCPCIDGFTSEERTDPGSQFSYTCVGEQTV